MNKSIHDLMDTIGKIERVHVETLYHSEPFIDLATRFSNIPGTTVLLSGGELECARYHILAALPFLTCVGKGRTMTLAV